VEFEGAVLMPIGGVEKFFRPVSLYRPVATDDEWDNKGITTWEHVAEIKGLFRQKNQSEQYNSKRQTMETTHVFYTDHQDIHYGDRIMNGNDSYDVKRAYNVMGFNQLIQVDCELMDYGR